MRVASRSVKAPTSCPNFVAGRGKSNNERDVTVYRSTATTVPWLQIARSVRDLGGDRRVRGVRRGEKRRRRGRLNAEGGRASGVVRTAISRLPCARQDKARPRNKNTRSSRIIVNFTQTVLLLLSSIFHLPWHREHSEASRNR